MDTFSEFKYLTEPQLLSFYGWWQLAVCFFAFLALIGIWWHIGRKQNDFGQVWLALSVLCWSFSGGVEVFFAEQFMKEGHVVYEKLNTLLESSALDQAVLETEYKALKNIQESRSFQLDGWRSILSLFNSLFILLALPWFRYIPKRIEAIVKSRYWRLMVGLLFLFSLLPTINKMLPDRTMAVISEMDVYYAILTLFFLGNVLWNSFEKRRLTVLAWLSLVSVIVTFVAQLYKLTDSDIDLTLLSAIFKTSLIMIFFALALSWVKELAENIMPEPDQLFLEFDRQKNDGGKFEHHVLLKGIPGKEEQKILLTPTLFNLLLKFARRKIVDGEGWLEIKPKTDKRSNKEYDIKDYNEIKRLLIALLDGLFGKGSWAKNQHLQPLKNALFEMSEKRERKIRLSLAVENIKLP